MRVVISQSMLFPWVGMLEQVRLADFFVHYDDVQFSKGGFVNRVQIKTPQGICWLTVPLANVHLGQRINEVEVLPTSQWRDTHLSLLKKSFAGAPHAADAIHLAEAIYAIEYPNLGALAHASLHALIDYFGLGTGTRFMDIDSLDIPGSGSARVLSVVKNLHGDVYITGHGAARYLNHDLFESSGVRVEYIDYRCRPYPQLHGEFTPYVTGLDLVANCGRSGIEYICSNTVFWRDFIHESE